MISIFEIIDQNEKLSEVFSDEVYQLQS